MAERSIRDMTISTLLPEAQGLQPDVVRLRRTIHRHPELGLQLPRTILASGGTIEAAIHGRGGHAFAPDDCLDPIPIACEIIEALQSLVTCRVDAFDPEVATIAKVQAGIHLRVGMFHEEN